MRKRILSSTLGILLRRCRLGAKPRSKPPVSHYQDEEIQTIAVQKEQRANNCYNTVLLELQEKLWNPLPLHWDCTASASFMGWEFNFTGILSSVLGLASRLTSLCYHAYEKVNFLLIYHHLCCCKPVHYYETMSRFWGESWPFSLSLLSYLNQHLKSRYKVTLMGMPEWGICRLK